MLRTPPNSRLNSKWRIRLKSFSGSPSRKSDGDILPTFQDCIQQTPSLSSSPSSTPYNTPPKLSRSLGTFLTPLDILDDDEFYPLMEQSGVLLGGSTLAPPPPRKWSRSMIDNVSGPRVKPYFTTHARQKTHDGTRHPCSICGDSLDSKLDNEKIISLQCGDCIHGECLETMTQVHLETAISSHQVSATSSEYEIQSLIVPNCKGNNCRSRGVMQRVDPTEEHLIPKLVREAMLSLKIAIAQRKIPEWPLGQMLEAELALDQKLLASHKHTASHSGTLLQPAPILARQSVCSTANRESRYFVCENSLLLLRGDVRSSVCPHSPTPSFATVSVSIEENRMQPLDEMRNAFIKHMLNYIPSFDLALLVSLGPLRLVDQLMVAFGQGNFAPAMVYLFSNFLIIWTNHSAPTLLPLAEGITTTVPETSVLQIEIDSKTVKLHSEIDSIIEKWGIVMSDVLIVLPSELFTSSIPVSELHDHKRVQPKAIFTNPWNNVLGKGEFKFKSKTKASPILEHLFEDSPRDSIVPRVLSANDDTLESELKRIGIIDGSTSYDISRPTSPLNITRSQGLLLANMSDADSDSDSDMELIENVLGI